ncbi:hypothetical protein B0I37DRAFT_445174 [Chaetomium sp. MPI-CAGE-AT-0009]|nr:hypothetical protein B0I37DRAFT_445174 [Chaetomium sp. MPI-CAGE-AT-0009]
MKRRFGTADLEWLHPDNFCDEPIYCESHHNPDEVLYHGSDDEEYSSPTERRLRFETQAERFLEGKPVFLLSASLRGPFNRESGWVNPWRSKSASREKAARRKRQATSRGAVPQIDSSGLFDSSSFRQPTPERRPAPPEVTYTLPRYMDGDAFHRVRTWRDNVVAESDPPASSIQQVSRSEPASADSRRATQQTYRRQSDITMDALEDGPASSGPPLWVEAGPVASNQARVKQDSPSSSLSSPPMSPLDPPSPSMRVMKSRQQLRPPARIYLYPSTEGSSSVKAPAADWLGDGNATPNGALVEATASSAQIKAQASARTDGSFRYRRKDAGGKQSPLGRSKLAHPPSAPSDTAELQSPGDRASPTTGTAADKEVLEPGFARAASVQAATTSPDTVPKAAEVQEQGIHEDAPQTETSQKVLPQAEEDDQSQSQIHIKDEDMTETASQIDGPTLVPSSSPSSSEQHSMPSFGHFSAEKHSQDVISEAVGMPRRLLWPNPRRSTSRGDFPPVVKRESVHTPAPTQSDSSSRRSHSVLSNRSIQTKEVMRPFEEDEGVQEPTVKIEDVQEPAVKIEDRIQEDPSAVGGVAVEVEGTAAEMTTDSETASEAEDQEDTSGTEEPQIEPPADSGPKGDGDKHMQPPSSCPAPQIQSPWTTDDATLRPRSQNSLPQHNEDTGTCDAQPTLLKSIQSPWTKTADDVPGASDIPTRLPYPNSASTKPSFMASQALEEKATQSPWARGDSQLQLPETRLFNHLSSPANSHVLPTAHPVPHSQVTHGEDVDMCDSQQYPQPPSTPETKQSSLPTPDFTLSVKSFKNFMTPSPRPAAKRRRISTAADGCLPSTQALVDAAISNPWTRPPTFGRHFAAVAGRRVGATPLRQRLSAADTVTALAGGGGGAATGGGGRQMGRPGPMVRLLPSASQQVCESPGVEAMAEAFLRAERGLQGVGEDDGGGGGGGGVVGGGESGVVFEKGVDGVDYLEEDRVEEGDTYESERVGAGEVEMSDEVERETQEEMVVDEVSAVMENLDDFLGGNWDLDADLAKARTAQARESREHVSMDSDGAMLSGLMDVGVWD